MNWKWPKSKKKPDFNPWYTIMRRLVLCPFLIMCFVVFIVAVAMFHSWNEAIEVSKRVR